MFDVVELYCAAQMGTSVPLWQEMGKHLKSNNPNSQVQPVLYQHLTLCGQLHALKVLNANK